MSDLVMDRPLTATERKELARCEAVIDRGLNTCFEVGKALEDIRIGGLYRETHKTYEAYCQERFGIGKSHAARLRDGAKVIEDLKTSPIGGSLPTSERQVRPLTRLPEPQQRVEAYQDAVQIAGGSPPTAAQVEQAVVQRFPPRAPHPLPITRTTSEDDFPDDVPVRSLDDEGDAAGQPCAHAPSLKVLLKTAGWQVYASDEDAPVQAYCQKCQREMTLTLL